MLLLLFHDDSYPIRPSITDCNKECLGLNCVSLIGSFHFLTYKYLFVFSRLVYSHPSLSSLIAIAKMEKIHNKKTVKVKCRASTYAEQIVILKKQLSIRETELRELKIKHEASVTREKNLTNGFTQIQLVMEQLDLNKETNNKRINEPTTIIVASEDTQAKSKKPKKKSINKNIKSSDVCEICQSIGHQLEDCVYKKEAEKRRAEDAYYYSIAHKEIIEMMNAKKKVQSSNDKKNILVDVDTEVTDVKKDDKIVSSGITHSDTKFVKQKRETVTVPGYLPMFPLGLTVEAIVGSKTSPTVLVASGSRANSITAEEVQRLGLGVTPLANPVKIEYPDNTSTISTHAAKFAPIIDGIQRPQSYLLVVESQSVPIILGFSWIRDNNFRLC